MSNHCKVKGLKIKLTSVYMQFMNTYDLSGMLFEIQILIALLIMKTQDNSYIKNQTSFIPAQTLSESTRLNAAVLKKKKK